MRWTKCETLDGTPIWVDLITGETTSEQPIEGGTVNEDRD